MPNYGEFYELRHFAVPSRTELGSAAPYIDSLQTFFNPDGCIFSCTDYPDFRFGIEICEDLWVASPPSDKLAAAGALVIVNCSAGDEIIGKADYRKRITEVQSAKNICAYLYCGAGEGESTSDMVFSGHCFVYENGTLLAEKAPFDYANDMLITEIDLGRLLYDRRRVNSFCAAMLPIPVFSLISLSDSVHAVPPRARIFPKRNLPAASRAIPLFRMTKTN